MLKREDLIENTKVLEDVLKYTYNDKSKLVHALTHSSYTNEKNKHLNSNERFEFLGDSVLNIAISEYIFLNNPNLTEGEMTRARASIVCEAPLAKCVTSLGLGKYLLLGKGEELTGGRTRPSILADAFEAIICSIYIDGGMEKAKEFIYNNLGNLIDEVVKGASTTDYKTKLQEILQKKGDNRAVYEVLDEKGPDHNKFFIVQVKVGGGVLGSGEGKSKKDAEQIAARNAIEKLQVSNNV